MYELLECSDFPYIFFLYHLSKGLHSPFSSSLSGAETTFASTFPSTKLILLSFHITIHICDLFLLFKPFSPLTFSITQQINKDFLVLHKHEITGSGYICKDRAIAKEKLHCGPVVKRCWHSCSETSGRELPHRRLALPQYLLAWCESICGSFNTRCPGTDGGCHSRF